MAQRVGGHPGAIGLADGTVGIGKKRKAQPFAFTEGFVVVDAIGADADDFCSGLQEVGVEAFKAPGFDGATAREIPWVEINRQPATTKITAVPLVPIRFGLARSGQIKIRFRCMWFLCSLGSC